MLNKVQIQGRLVRDPEGRRTQTGKTVANFCIASGRNTKEREADFIDCVAWENTANFILTYFKKGSEILIAGTLQTRIYEKDGKKNKFTEVVVQEANFCGSSGTAQESTQTASEENTASMSDAPQSEAESFFGGVETSLPFDF